MDRLLWDLLEMLGALIEAYKEDHAEELKRKRLQRNQELHEEAAHKNQLRLPLHDWGG